MFTVYCHAQINCDAKKCKAPYEEREGLEVVRRDKADASRVVLKLAREAGWKQVKKANGHSKWYCKHCKIGE